MSVLHFYHFHSGSNFVGAGSWSEIDALKDIKDLTAVRGQDGKISDTQGKDFLSQTRLR